MGMHYVQQYLNSVNLVSRLDKISRALLKTFELAFNNIFRHYIVFSVIIMEIEISSDQC